MNINKINVGRLASQFNMLLIFMILILWFIWLYNYNYNVIQSSQGGNLFRDFPTVRDKLECTSTLAVSIFCSTSMCINTGASHNPMGWHSFSDRREIRRRISRKNPVFFIFPIMVWRRTCPLIKLLNTMVIFNVFVVISILSCGGYYRHLSPKV